MAAKRETRTTETEIKAEGMAGGETSLVITGDIPNLHDNPKKVDQLLDLLGIPKGTHVRLTTKASSVIVR